MNKVEASIDKLIPVVTEKALKLSEDSMVVFKAPKDFNKALSIKTLEAIYKGNKVKDIKSILVKGKVKKFKRVLGKRKDYKKLYVRFEKPVDITTEVK